MNITDAVLTARRSVSHGTCVVACSGYTRSVYLGEQRSNTVAENFFMSFLSVVCIVFRRSSMALSSFFLFVILFLSFEEVIPA